MSTFSYENFKAMAKEAGVQVADLLALSVGNDPFYVGAPAQLAKAEWFAGIYAEMGSPPKCHIRRAHYWLVSRAYLKPDGTAYENTERDWGLVTVAAKYARYLGLVPIENIIDRRNPAPIVNARHYPHEAPSEVRDRIDTESLIDQIVGEFWCFNPHRTQAHLLEIWCEKSTMNDVLEPLCQRYGLNLVTGLGELSITAVHQLVDRVEEAEKPTRIFYISDFDPAGECMPVSVARKLEFFVASRGVELDIKLVPLMLTAAQCRRYRLPRTPIKETERRRDGFEGRHGEGATELDALEALRPGEMARILTTAIEEYFDVDAWNAAISKNRELQEAVRSYLAGRIDGSLLSALDTSPFERAELPIGAEVEDEGEQWLYHSARTYAEQLRRYKEHQAQGKR